MTCGAVCALSEREPLVHPLSLKYKVASDGPSDSACLCASGKKCPSAVSKPKGVSVSRELPSQSHSRSAHLLILHQHCPPLHVTETERWRKKTSAVFLSLRAFLSYVILVLKLYLAFWTSLPQMTMSDWWSSGLSSSATAVVLSPITPSVLPGIPNNFIDGTILRDQYPAVWGRTLRSQ